MKNPIIRTIYLYLFALIGLGMLVIGCSMIINLGLKAWIFTNADQQDTYISRPMPINMDSSEKDFVKSLETCSDKCELTENQKDQVASWLENYEKWESGEETKDPNLYTKRNRERQASTAISLILIGLPLWLFHWFTIKKDIKRNKV